MANHDDWTEQDRIDYDRAAFRYEEELYSERLRPIRPRVDLDGTPIDDGVGDVLQSLYERRRP